MRAFQRHQEHNLKHPCLLDEEESKHTPFGWAKIGFDPTVLQRDADWGYQKANQKACLIPDIDWLDSSIGPGELLLVNLRPFAAPVLILSVELGKNKELILNASNIVAEPPYTQTKISGTNLRQIESLNWPLFHINFFFLVFCEVWRVCLKAYGPIDKNVRTSESIN